MRKGRKLLFTLVAVLLCAALTEGCAWVLERIAPAPQRSWPVAAPGSFMEVNHAAEAKRAEYRTQGIPLMEDPRMGWGLPINRAGLFRNAQIRTNQLGLRGPDLAPKQEGELRLLSLGDSSVFGDGISELNVFSNVAADLLTAQWKRDVRGVIGAVPGHSTSQALAQLERVGSAVQPDWVLVACLWSDVFKDQGKDRTDITDELRGPLRVTATYRWLRRLLAPWLVARQVSYIRGVEDVGQLQGPDRSRTLLAQYISNLEALVAATKALGARPAFLILPAPMDLDAAPPPETIQAFREGMRQVAQTLGAPLADGPAEFRQAGANIGFFSDQVHPSTEGHLLLGRIVADSMAPYEP